METFTNIQEANQQIGALGVQLETEKKARTAVTTDLETATAAHSAELETLKTQHKEQLEALQGTHAKAVTTLNDKVDGLKNEVTTLNETAQTASEQAAGIVAEVGGAPVEAEGQEEADNTPKTQEEIHALYVKQRSLPIAARHSFYKEHIKPHVNR
jgi:hypothetical protein